MTDQDSVLTLSTLTSYSPLQPFLFNPYPPYSSEKWRSSHEKYAPCLGPTGQEVTDNTKVFKGHLKKLLPPGFGSYRLLGVEENLCFERETHFGPYGLTDVSGEDGRPINWDEVNWGGLQEQCFDRNRARFNSSGPDNPYLESPYGILESEVQLRRFSPGISTAVENVAELARRDRQAMEETSTTSEKQGHNTTANESMSRSRRDKNIESRTAILLRTWTGKEYTDNDKQVIRSLITELNLRTGGEYQVFLFVHSKEETRLWEPGVYDRVLEREVPREFRNMSILWSEDQMALAYPQLGQNPELTLVHNSQFLAVQQFSQANRQFDYVWNWEIDSRVIGHHYDWLNKIAAFAKKQPRKGLWERNERFYIPSYHGDYDTTFRAMVKKKTKGSMIWEPPELSYVKPVGPKPPTSQGMDDYEWGVGEEADLITLGPMFNPADSNWVMRDQVWGYVQGRDLPRRATIITQSRISRRLLDIMHVENLRGNHVGSEMAPQTVALLHGLKAVYAPMPVYFDRPWSGAQLQRWFNIGPGGLSGGWGSAFGWGREARFQGVTWYFRAEPPQRLYNNWMGYEDTGIGGAKWEAENGRPCLPAMIMHPIKDVRPTAPGTSSESKLAY